MGFGTQNAKKCFAENLQLFGNAQTNPEKYNLYKGLANLAKAIEGLERYLSTLEDNLKAVNGSVQSMRR